MKTTLILLFSLFVLTAQAGNIKGNGNVVTKDISVSDYDQIIIGGGINCQGGTTWLNKSVNPEFEYEQSSGKATLQVTTDENLFPLLTVEVVGNKLTISRKNDKDQLVPTRFTVKGNSKGLTNLVTSGCIDFVTKSTLLGEQLKIKVSGSSDVHFNKSVQLNNLDISVSGSGDIRVGDLVCTFIECAVSGSGDIKVKGAADRAKYRVSGSGDISAYDLVVKDLECSVSGSGDIKAHASETIKAKASGTGDISYKGNATATISKSGMSDIRKVN